MLVWDSRPFVEIGIPMWIIRYVYNHLIEHWLPNGLICMVHNGILVIPEGIDSIRFTLSIQEKHSLRILKLLKVFSWCCSSTSTRSHHPSHILQNHGAFLATAVAAATITVAFPGTLSALAVVATLQTCQSDIDQIHQWEDFSLGLLLGRKRWTQLIFWRLGTFTLIKKKQWNTFSWVKSTKILKQYKTILLPGASMKQHKALSQWNCDWGKVHGTVPTYDPLTYLLASLIDSR